MNYLKMIRGCLAVVACLCASAAWADMGKVTGFVKRTAISDDGSYGGCMAQMSESLTTSQTACEGTWVTFSCDGTYTEPVRALRMLDQAQLALATGMRVTVFVDDAKMQDGYCFAWRIDLLSY